jgi:hypothetical protein
MSYGLPKYYFQASLVCWEAQPAHPRPSLISPWDTFPLTGLDALGGAPTQVAGPGFSRLDFSLFKDFQLSERFLFQLRTEFFNILNHPTFNAPGSIPGSLDFKSPYGASLGPCL